MGISLVITVRNEEESIEAFMETVLRQTKPPDDMVVVDGGSEDATVRRLIRYLDDRRIPFPIHLIRFWGANIARGRNMGVAAARKDILAISDAGCELHDVWIEEITRPFEDPDVHAVAGNYSVVTSGFWEAAVSAMTIPDPESVAQDLPSSRSMAIRRVVWEKTGGYPEHLDWAEDTAFAMAVRRNGYTFRFARDAIVDWRPRRNPVSLFRQYARYAMGDGRAGHFTGHYVRRLVGLLILVLLAIFRIQSGGITVALLLGLFAAYWLHFVRKVPRSRWTARYLLLSPPVLLISDAARVIGYMVGLLKRVVDGIR
jgi:glycosyltransferase involved in cell wall biosynthesis